MDQLSLFFNSLFMALAMSAPYLVLGYIAAALIKEYVSRESLARHLGDKGVRPILNAVGIGALLPICSCGVIPLGVGVHRAGAARGTALSFMTSSPAISPVSIVMVGMMLGPLYLATYATVALLGSLLIGLIGNRLLRDQTRPVRDFDSIVEQVEEEDEHHVPGPEGGSRIKRAMHWAFWDLGSEISVDLTIGLSVAALVLAFLPIELTEAYLGTRSIWTLLLVILIGIPVYTCSVPTIPIVWALFMRGAMPGAMLAYMIAGPATNLGELNAIRRSMGIGAATFYTVGLLLVALAGGLVANHVVFSSYEYKSTMIAENELEVQECCVPMIFGNRVERNNLGRIAASVPKWHYPFIVVLLVTISVGFYQRFGRRTKDNSNGESGKDDTVASSYNEDAT
ncbi:MAG: permease [Planctomycetota bacterium]